MVTLVAQSEKMQKRHKRGIKWHKIHKIRGLHKLTKQKGSKRHKTAAWRLRFWGLSRVFCGLISLVRFDRSRHLCQEREELPAPRIDHGAHWQDPLPHHATLRSDAAGPARSYPLWMSGGVQEQGQHVWILWILLWILLIHDDSHDDSILLPQWIIIYDHLTEKLRETGIAFLHRIKQR